MKFIFLISGILISTFLMAQACPQPLQSSTALPRMSPISGTCNFPASFLDDSLVGLSTDLFLDAATCGQCIEVNDPLGSTLLTVDSECSTCPSNTLDISQDQFSAIADISGPNPTVTWKLTDCPVSGNVKILFNTGSNPWYLSFLVYNTRYPVSIVEFWTGTTYVELSRTAWNYYDTSLLVPAQLQFRITDVYGQQIIASGVPFVSGSIFDSNAQFPLCTNVGISDAVAIEAIQLFPNPADNTILIVKNQENGLEGQVRLFDLSGRLLMERKMISDRLEVNVETLPVGIYNLGYITEKKSFYRKVIISR